MAQLSNCSVSSTLPGASGCALYDLNGASGASYSAAGHGLQVSREGGQESGGRSVASQPSGALCIPAHMHPLARCWG